MIRTPDWSGGRTGNLDDRGTRRRRRGSRRTDRGSRRDRPARGWARRRVRRARTNRGRGRSSRGNEREGYRAVARPRPEHRGAEAWRREALSIVAAKPEPFGDVPPRAIEREIAQPIDERRQEPPRETGKGAPHARPCRCLMPARSPRVSPGSDHRRRRSIADSTARWVSFRPKKRSLRWQRCAGRRTFVAATVRAVRDRPSTSSGLDRPGSFGVLRLVVSPPIRRRISPCGWQWRVLPRSSR